MNYFEKKFSAKEKVLKKKKQTNSQPNGHNN